MKSAGGILEIIKRDGNLVPYDRDRISSAIFRAMASLGQGNRAQAEAFSEDVERSLLEAYGAGAAPSVEEIQDIVEETLMTRGAPKIARAYIIYRNQRTQARAARAYSFEAADNIPYKKIYEVLRWNMDHGCDSISNLNALIAGGHFLRLIRESDRRYEEELDQCAGQILSARGLIRLVIIAGPSSSGKTTTTAKLVERLTSGGLGFKALNVDNYFFDLEQHPKDEFGDHDYEAPQSLDLALINEHLRALLAGKTIQAPRYDFKTGKRTLAVEPLRLGADEILLLDSLHGLYRDMTESIPAEQKFRVYIETLGQLRAHDGAFMRWADHRLMRRMIRDSEQRNSRPETTLTHWHYVRRSELKNIIPFITTADFLVNSALPYEIPILKHHVFRYFPEAIARYRQEASRQDAYIRAKRIYDFLGSLSEVADDTCVASDSLLREFIGGSRYET
ncbi:MAG: response regulator SirA [Lentisphaerae bacterium]|nr:response regulator SirA [Lentisphaerota bacterium]